SLIACCSCGVMTSPWPCRISSRALSAKISPLGLFLAGDLSGAKATDWLMAAPWRGARGSVTLSARWRDGLTDETRGPAVPDHPGAAAHAPAGDRRSHGRRAGDLQADHLPRHRRPDRPA